MHIALNVSLREAETLLRFLRTMLDEDVKKLSSWGEVRDYKSGVT
jgi:hypothetical protein